MWSLGGANCLQDVRLALLWNTRNRSARAGFDAASIASLREASPVIIRQCRADSCGSLVSNVAYSDAWVSSDTGRRSRCPTAHSGRPTNHDASLLPGCLL